MGLLEQSKPQSLSKCVQANGQIEFFLGNGNQQVRAYCNPDLTVNSVLTGPVKCLDMQMLFDPFEESLDLPSFPVELCNG